MVKRILFFGLLILLVLPLVYAGSYGAGSYGLGLYDIGEVVDDSGSGGGSSRERDSIPKQFDIKILEFDSPISLGESFEFVYFIKGVGDFNVDVVIDFWIEKNGVVVTSGSDVVFMGENEEKTETGRLFMPSDVEPGVYKFIAKVSYRNVMAEAHRTVELKVRDNEVTIDSLFDIRFSSDKVTIKNSDELAARIVFENFGFNDTEVNLTFVILDEDGNEVYRGNVNVLVETEEFLRKSFEGLDLSAGRYTLILKALYEGGGVDEFRQDFEIVGEDMDLSHLREYWVWYLVGIVVLIFLVGIVMFLLKRRKRGRKRVRRKGKKKKR